MSAAQGDSLRAVLDSVFRSGAYNWVPDRDPLAWPRRAWQGFLALLRAAQEASPLGVRLLAYGVVFVLLLILGHALWVFAKSIRPTAIGPAGSSTPLPPIRDAGWFRQEAQRHASGGRYRAAIEADFRALVLTLEQRAVLTVTPSATPAEYARSAQFTPAAREQFEETVRRLYGYLFARWPCGPEEYAAWQAATNPDRYAPAH
jgi:hypothetical protein